MFGNKKTISDRIKDTLTDYLDEKFDDYRGQIAFDLSRGLAALAGLIALWSVAIVSSVFLMFALALFIGWCLSFFMASGSYIVSFGGMAILVLAGTYHLIKNKKRYIEQPVFDIMSKMLRSTVVVTSDKETASETQFPIENNNPQTSNAPLIIQNEIEEQEKKL